MEASIMITEKCDSQELILESKGIFAITGIRRLVSQRLLSFLQNTFKGEFMYMETYIEK